MTSANGTLTDGRVLVEAPSQADRLRDKGAYGQRVDAGLALDLNEAAYLVEADRLTVRDADGAELSVPELIAEGTRSSPRFETEHLVYRDYRSRGYVLERGDEELDGWARGAQPPRQAPSTLICPRSEADPVTPEALLGLIARSHGLGRGLLLAVVDEESDVTYYEADLAHVTGDVDDPASQHAGTGAARVLLDRAILLEDAGLQAGGYGHEVGGEVFLSLAEAWHLARNGLTIEDAAGDALAADQVLERAHQAHADAGPAFGAYAWARERGLVPKTGFKFGVHYRVYEEPPDQAHAPYLLQAMSADEALTFRELARFVRLAHSVRKKPLVWTQEGALMVEWTRP